MDEEGGEHLGLPGGVLDAALVGRFDREGRLVAAGAGLAARLAAGDRDLAGALDAASARRWRRAVVAAADPLGPGRCSVTLRLARGPRPRRHRCLVATDGVGDLWLVGVPAGSSARPALEGAGEAAELRRRLARLRRAARRRLATDPLTGAASRWLAERWLRRVDGSAAPLGCLMIDLDAFKRVNDEHGHLEGDRWLRGAAAALAAALEPPARAARWGGDEFLVLVPGATRDGLAALADRLRDALAGALPEGSGASLGVALRGPGEPSRRLLARADAALVRAKRAGRGRVELDAADDAGGGLSPAAPR